MITQRPNFKHIIVEVRGEDKYFNSIEILRDKINQFINKLGLKIQNEIHHKFSPEGITLVFILSTSHLIVHSWPEKNYLHIDLLTCLPEINIETAKNFILDIFEKTSIQIFEIDYKTINYDDCDCNAQIIDIIQDAKENGRVVKGVLESRRSIQKNRSLIVIAANDVSAQELVTEIKALCNKNNTPFVISNLSQKDVAKPFSIKRASFVAIEKPGLHKKIFINLLLKISESSFLNNIQFDNHPHNNSNLNSFLIPYSLKGISKVEWIKENDKWITKYHFVAKAKADDEGIKP